MLKKFSKFIFISSFFLLSSCTIPAAKTTKKNPSVPTPTNQNLTVIGVIRTLSLPFSDRQKYGWSQSEYQLEEFPLEDHNQKPNHYALFLDQQSKVSQYLNQCVEVTAQPNPTKQATEQTKPVIIPLIFISAKPVAYSQCNPFLGLKQPPKDQPSSSLTGIVSFQSRPSPDTNFDYFITTNSQPEPLKMQLVPANQESWQKLNQTLGKNVTVTGYYLNGDPDSKYLQVYQVQ